MKKLILSLPVLGMACLPSYAAIDIASDITAFQSTAEGYAGDAIPAVFVVVAIYFLYRLIKRFTK